MKLTRQRLKKLIKEEWGSYESGEDTIPLEDIDSLNTILGKHGYEIFLLNTDPPQLELQKIR